MACYNYPTTMMPFGESSLWNSPMPVSNWPSMTPNWPSMMSPMTPFGELFGMNPSANMPWMWNHANKMNMMNSTFNRALPREIRDVSFRPTSMVEYNTFLNPVEYHVDGSRTMHVCFDVKGFKPEEVKVDISPKERCITVEAKHEVKEKDHAVTRHYLRKFYLPEELHIDLTKTEIKSCLTPDGLLVVEGVLPRITVEELKSIREKAPTKTPAGLPMPIACPTGNIAISIPVKMN